MRDDRYEQPGHDTEARGAPAAGPTPLFRLDAGWLFLVSGLALAASAVLIPAQLDLERAEWRRDDAFAIEERRLVRIGKYASYLESLLAHDETLARALAKDQFNTLPEGWRSVGYEDPGVLRSASPFAALEPDDHISVAQPAARSRLAKLATHERLRLWLIAGAGLCLLLGLLPGRTGEASREPARP